jgi:hypothetical protein
MLKPIDWPPEQDVPAATGWATDHEPLAHCWKEVPPIQLNMPSLVQAPLRAPALEVLDVPELLDAGVGAAEAAVDAAVDAAASVVMGVALGAV